MNNVVNSRQQTLGNSGYGYRTSFMVVLVGIGIVACSGSQSADLGDAATGTCGAGTTLVNGQCVVADGGAADAEGGDAPDALADDPCPPLTPATDDVVNCSSTCGSTRPDKCSWGCDAPAITIAWGTAHFPFYIRTPHDFSKSTTCNPSCGPGGGVSHGIRLNFNSFPTNQLNRLRVRLDLPFYVAPSGNSPGCYLSPAATKCFALSSSAASDSLDVFTLPGSTASRSQNIVIESVPDGQPICP